MVLACRSAERAESAKADIDKELRQKAEGGQPYAKVGKVVVRILDLGSLRAVGDFAREIRWVLWVWRSSGPHAHVFSVGV